MSSTSGVTSDNSAVNMIARSEVPVAMDDATGVSTAVTLPSNADVAVRENFDMGGVSDNSLDLSVSPQEDEKDTAAPPATPAVGEENLQ